MAYMNQEKKAKIKVELDKVLKDTGIKYSLKVQHHSAIICTLYKGPVDFLSNYEYREEGRDYIKVNQFYYKDHFTGKALEIVGDILKALNLDNFNESDVQSDYFYVGHYYDLNIGTYDKPYILIKE